MSAFWFSGSKKRHARSARPTKRPNARLEVEALETRLVMNTYFVVPGAANNTTTFASLHDALTMPALQNGDVIQIEPGATPGHIQDSDIKNVQNLTIQGDSTADVQAIPQFFTDSPVFITSMRQGFTLKHLQLKTVQGSVVFEANGTITDCRVQVGFAGDGVDLEGTTAAVISDSIFEITNSQNTSASLVSVTPGNGSHNTITDNQFIALTGTNIGLMDYGDAVNSADVVAHNTFLGSTGAQPLLHIHNVQGLTVQSNTFTDGSDNGIGIQVDPMVQNLKIVDNVVSVASTTFGIGIFVKDTQQTGSSSMVIADNHVSTAGHGVGLQFNGEKPGVTFVAKVENNDLHGNGNGVFIDIGLGGSVAGIDLGGGAQGSKGANDFRGDPGAIFCFAHNGAGTIQAQMNIFGVADPTTVIHDHANDATLASVVATNPLTGNAAFVETLFLDFLHRTGDLSSQGDAGGWVTQLGQGLSPGDAASLIARSLESAAVQVNSLYHRFLGREADPAGLTAFMNFVHAGGTLEAVEQSILAGPEFQLHTLSDSDYVIALYQDLLHRPASPAEVNNWLAALPQMGRAGVAQAVTLSPEFRTNEVNDDYAQLLHRMQPPAPAEANNWVGSGLDILTMDAFFAGSLEFQLNG
jgi:hypothetical protein